MRLVVFVLMLALLPRLAMANGNSEFVCLHIGHSHTDGHCPHDPTSPKDAPDQSGLNDHQSPCCVDVALPPSPMLAAPHSATHCLVATAFLPLSLTQPPQPAAEPRPRSNTGPPRFSAKAYTCLLSPRF